MSKRNECIVIRRTHNAELFLNEVSGYNSPKDGFDWEEFEDAVSGYSNQGYTCQGGISMLRVDDNVIVAQAMIYKRD